MPPHTPATRTQVTLELPPPITTFGKILPRCLLSLVLVSLQAASAQSFPPLSPDPLSEARSLLIAGKLSLAEARLRSIISASPRDPEPRFLLAVTLFREQRAADSLGAFTAASTLRNPTAEELTIVASDYILLKDFADARRWLTLATQTSPTNATAWYLLGRTNYNLDLAEAARQAFLTCLRLQPDHVKARYNLGLAYERLRQPEDALAAYHQAIALERQLSQKDSQPYLDLGMLLLQQGKPQEALDPLKTAVQLAGNNPLAHQQLALCFEKLGLYQQAADEMVLCARLAPESQAPPFFLGRIYRRLGRNTEAKEQFARTQMLAGTHSDTDVPNLELPSP